MASLFSSVLGRYRPFMKTESSGRLQMPGLGETEHKGVYRWWILLMGAGMGSSGHSELGIPHRYPDSSLLGHLLSLIPAKGTLRSASPGLAGSAGSPNLRSFVSFLAFPEPREGSLGFPSKSP